MVAAWAGDYGLALGRQVCDAKSNEITALPELLGKIDVRGGIVTIDAMGRRRRSPSRSSTARPTTSRR